MTTVHTAKDAYRRFFLLLQSGNKKSITWAIAAVIVAAIVFQVFFRYEIVTGPR